ncbi:MAG: hypothetical protein ABF756_10230 [Liquorilactobacillus ghanensis]|uniref:hypothetical protein n=1 Tax=Liquorilactobacillus ghanensis TaxID=399370 RepID=UPI0039EB6EF8
MNETELKYLNKLKKYYQERLKYYQVIGKELSRFAWSENKKVELYVIKVSDDIKRDLDIIKSIHKIKFDYESIQFLIDSYSNSLSPEDQRRFTVLRENL